MEASYIESKPSRLADLRRGRRPYVNELGQSIEGAGTDTPSAESLSEAPHALRSEEAGLGWHAHMSANELESHLVRAIAVRTHGQVQALRVQFIGGRTILSGFAESYYAIQLAVVGLQETMDALGLDRPGRVDLNIDVVPRLPPRP